MTCFMIHVLCSMERIYLDYAATTPVDPAVLKAMQPYFSEKFGNAGSLHSFGQEASAALDASRETVAKELGADFREIIFTASATEANNLALRGITRMLRMAHTNATNFTPRIITTKIEHESILETCRGLEKEGVEVVYLPVDKNGVVQLTALQENLNESTILVSIMSANNEIGSIQPIAEIGKLILEFRKRKAENKSAENPKSYILDSIFPLLHVDHSQGFQYLDLKPKELGIDLMTISSHKIYGPKGAGVLFMNHEAWSMEHSRKNMFHVPGSMFHAVETGGNQEFGLRSGTENIPAVVGFAKAVELVSNSRELENKRVAELRDYFWQELKKIYPKAELNGLDITRIVKSNTNATNPGRLPNNLNVYFPGHSAEDLLIKFDMAGIAVSAGSACSARSAKPSHVLEACGFPKERIKSSLRITLGRPTTKAEIEEAIKRMEKILIDTN